MASDREQSTAGAAAAFDLMTALEAYHRTGHLLDSNHQMADGRHARMSTELQKVFDRKSAATIITMLPVDKHKTKQKFGV
jgi:hypothetical protein